MRLRRTVLRALPRRELLRIGISVASVVLCINAAVRVFGHGDPYWLSPLYLPQKVSALGFLARHLLSHDSDCGDAAGALVERAAARNGVAPRLALAVARSESALRPHAISRTGAMGLMQLMPATARGLGLSDPFDPAQNADAGTRYLAWLSRRYRGDRVRVLAAYNAGPARVPQRGALELPAETRAYVARVLRRTAPVRAASM